MPHVPQAVRPRVFEGLQGGQERPTQAEGVTGQVAGAKKPRNRPPRSLRDGLAFIVKRLPGYTGPYSVGTMEVEIPAREPRAFSKITRHKRHILQLKTILFTIYYPATEPPPESKDREDPDYQKHSKHPSRQPWLGRPRLGMMHGMSKFASLGWVGMPLFVPVCWTKLPAWRNAPLSDKLPVEGVTFRGRKLRETKWKQGRLKDPPPGERPIRFPLIMFSHGLGGTKSMYSSICGEMASYGYIVCAVEHRDGSGPRTYVNRPPDIGDMNGDVGHSTEKGPLKIKDGYDIVDYIFPQGNPHDTGPQNEQGVDRELRDHQIELRMAEFTGAFDALQLINAGRGQEIADGNIRIKPHVASSSHGLNGVLWDQWKDRTHLEDVTVLGHSFGAATIVELLRHQEKFPYLGQGIILDIWSAGTKPLKKEGEAHRLKAPLLAINTEAFSYWPSNFDFVRKLTSEANPCPTWMTTIRGTVHMAPSDIPLLYPRLCSLFLKSTANPERALDLHVDQCLSFLSTILPPAHTEPFSHAYPPEQWLEQLPVQPLEKIPSGLKHKPPDKWIASRLKIDKEWKWRLAPTEKIGRRWISPDEEFEKGKGEVWVHSRPDDELVEEWCRKRDGRRGKMAHDGKDDASSQQTHDDAKTP